jgi:hypothetical protein
VKLQRNNNQEEKKSNLLHCISSTNNKLSFPKVKTFGAFFFQRTNTHTQTYIPTNIQQKGKKVITFLEKRR